MTSRSDLDFMLDEWKAGAIAFPAYRPSPPVPSQAPDALRTCRGLPCDDCGDPIDHDDTWRPTLCRWCQRESLGERDDHGPDPEPDYEADPDHDD